MQGDAIAELDSTDGPSQTDLVDGLQLVRASTLKLARLQLALERRDRRVALEAVDDLVRYDQSLEQHLSGLRDPHEHSVMDLAVAVERAALNREKLTLAAEIISNGNDAPEVDPQPPEEQIEAFQPSPVINDTEDPADEAFPAEEWFDAWEEEPQPRQAIRWLLAAILLLAAIGAAVWWTGVSASLEWLEAVPAELLKLAS